MAFSGSGAEPQPCPPAPRGNLNGSPTLEQQEAIALLSNQDHEDILAYLKYVRSVSGGAQCKEGSGGQEGGLSIQQVDAIKTLSRCADRKLRTWLRDDRTSGDAGTIENSQGSTPAFRYASVHDRSTVLGHPSEAQSSITASSRLQQSASQVEEPHLYRCTLCKEHRSYKNDSDWKKHEREHEYTYICTPDGWLGTTESGTECVFCGLQEPDEQHAFEHDAHACHFSCKRRENMPKHLSKFHGVLDPARGLKLAKEWLRGSGRQFWSCGLCVSLFTSLQDRLKHIDVEHFRRRQSFEEWNVTNVIHGLLKQPEVREAWEAQMTAHHGWEQPKVVWGASKLGDLQLKLEMGPSDKQSAISLANAAFDVCEIREYNGWNETPSLIGDRHESSEISSAIFKDHHQLVSAHTPYMHPSTLEPVPGEAQRTYIYSNSGEGHGDGQVPALSDSTINCDNLQHKRSTGPSFSPKAASAQMPEFALDFSELNSEHEEASFNGFADPVFYSDMDNNDFTDTVRPWESA